MVAHLCDSNVWLALALSRHVHHAAARSWLDTVDEPESVLFCRATQQTFLRLLTNAAVLASRWEEFALRDAYLAAFALAGGHRLVTTDSAFQQFSGLDLLLLG